MHNCNRFKTLYKRNGVRHLVACRVCGKKRMVIPLHNITGPKVKLQ